MQLFLGAIIIAIAVYAIARRVDVRLVLLLAALGLGGLALQPWAIVIVFFETFANEQFVVPICCAMGFAYTLRHTGCDQHLVHLLVKPLSHVRFLLVPGTVIVGFIVNIPIISQTSTAASLGPVVIPILAAARLKAVTIGAVLLLGCSIGGELLNPGAPELRTVVEESRKLLQQKAKKAELAGETVPVVPIMTEDDVVQRILPLDLLALVTATGLFWYLSAREEARSSASDETIPTSTQGEAAVEDFRINYVKATIPFVPLVLLFLTGPPLNIVSVPPEWLVRVPPIQTTAGEQLRHALAVSPQAGAAAAPWALLANQDEAPLPPNLTGLFNSRRIGLAMLIGVLCAGLVAWRSALQVPRQFFEGAGYAFANIVSLIVTARCFGEGIKLIGLAKLLGDLMHAVPWLLIPLSGALSVIFGALSGSGMATTQSVLALFAAPAVDQGVDPTLIGAVVGLASAAGRTMSPVAAVCLMCATLTNTSPFALAQRVALPLIAGVVAVIIAAIVFG